jgi:hypothetical protein
MKRLLLGGLIALGPCLAAVVGCVPPMNDMDREGFTIASLSGSGELTLIADTSDLVMSAPLLTGVLTPAGVRGDPITLDFDMSSGAPSYSGSVPAGCYLLQLELSDGSKSVASFVDAVVVEAGSATVESLSCKPKDGSVVVQLVDKITRAFPVALSGAQSTLEVGATMTVTASPAVPVDSYQWYLDGQAIRGATGKRLTVGSGLEVGDYTLTLVVKKGSVYSSQSVGFTVAAASGTN